MNRLRRPWTLQRQKTDGIQLNTTEDFGKKPSGSDEENGVELPEKNGAGGNVEPVDMQHGHLQEIEVDLDHVVHDQELKDIDSDTSPYPEVVSVQFFFLLFVLTEEPDIDGISVRSCPKPTIRPYQSIPFACGFWARYGS